MKGKALFLAASLTLACEPAQANDTQSDVMRALQSQGYSVERVGRTFLGRIKLTVSDATTTREIIVSRYTGEVLHQRTLVRRQSFPES